MAIGPESTGKSTLCRQLANHYNTNWVKEYAREFIAAHREYSYEDLLTIAKGQIKLEDETAMSCEQTAVNYEQTAMSDENTALSKKKQTLSDEPLAISKDGLQKKAIRSLENFLFIDTDMHVMKVWSEFVYNRCHNWILSQIATRKYDGYLLCNIDLPWEQDGMREYPDKKVREKIYRFYKDMMVNQSVPWIEISGNYEERTEMAIRFIETI